MWGRMAVQRCGSVYLICSVTVAVFGTRIDWLGNGLDFVTSSSPKRRPQYRRQQLAHCTRYRGNKQQIKNGNLFLEFPAQICIAYNARSCCILSPNCTSLSSWFGKLETHLIPRQGPATGIGRSERYELSRVRLNKLSVTVTRFLLVSFIPFFSLLRIFVLK